RARILVRSRVEEGEHISDSDVGHVRLLEDHVESARDPYDIRGPHRRSICLLGNDQGPAVAFQYGIQEEHLRRVRFDPGPRDRRRLALEPMNRREVDSGISEKAPTWF